MKSLLAPFFGLCAAALLATPAQAWWKDDWTQRTRVVLDTTDKGLVLPSSPTEVVVPVRLHSGNFDFTNAAPDGADLRVVGADDHTPLAFEIESFDSVNELATVWVRTGTVAQGSAANVVHLYAGNAHASAEPDAASPFAQGYAAVLHFSQNAGSFKEASAGLTMPAGAMGEAHGLLAGALRATGQALTVPLQGRLALAPNGALSVAMWVRPDAGNGPSTLLALGPLKLVRAVDEVEARFDGKALTAGALPAGAWTHVALTVAAGKATLFVNGQARGTADVLLPQATPDLQLGEGFQGLIDEVQVLGAARDEGWVRLMAASQGADNGFIKTIKEEAGAAQEAGGGYFGLLLKNLTPDAWAVIGVLMVMFAIAAWVMVSKALLVARLGRQNEAFIGRFREAMGPAALGVDPAFAGSSLWRLYDVGTREIAKRRAAGAQALSTANLDAIKATLDATLVRENHTLNARMVLLTIAISGGPFLGLLGTVVGVMITFAAIAAAGDVNVNAIAPGIAAALLATVAGLGVAIPALFGYNWLAARIKNISADMQIFVDEFVTRAAETHGA